MEVEQIESEPVTSNIASGSASAAESDTDVPLVAADGNHNAECSPSNAFADIPVTDAELDAAQKVLAKLIEV